MSKGEKPYVDAKLPSEFVGGPGQMKTLSLPVKTSMEAERFKIWGRMTDTETGKVVKRVGGYVGEINIVFTFSFTVVVEEKPKNYKMEVGYYSNGEEIPVWEHELTVKPG